MAQTQFGLIQWSMVIGFFALTTLIGALFAGKQATIRDFFLAGRKLPWYAVSASMVSTEISAVTIVSVPAIVFAEGGNFAYLQLGLLGSILARILVGYYFVPAFYEREIYSPYDYVARHLGQPARTMISTLFMLGGVLAQGARLYLAALVLDLIVGQSALGWLAAQTGTRTLTCSIWIMGFFSILWTLMGGMQTVIWTDVMLFLVFLGSSIAALLFVVSELPGGWAELISVGADAGKFTFFNFDPSPSAEFTIWTALFANTWGCLAIFGTDQLLAQRMFCCRSPREARWAIIASSLGQLVTITVCFVGVALFAFYHRNPPSELVASAVAENRNNIFPAFIISEMTRLPFPLAGLAVAGIFAAAVSSILAALSETTLSAFYLPIRAKLSGRWRQENDPTEQRHRVRIARGFILFWGIILCLMAQVAEAASGKFPEILNLALAMAGYCGGALLAGFLLAFFRLKIDGVGYLFSAPLSVLTVFAVVWHEAWSHPICSVGAGLLILAWAWMRRPEQPVGAWLWKSLFLTVGLLFMLWLNHYGYLEAVPKADGGSSFKTFAWPWFIPIGSTVAFVWGWALAGKRDASQAAIIGS